MVWVITIFLCLLQKKTQQKERGGSGYFDYFLCGPNFFPTPSKRRENIGENSPNRKRMQIYNFAPSMNLFIKRRENIGESSPVKKKKCTFTTLPIFLICLLGAILTNLVSQFFFYTYIKQMN